MAAALRCWWESPDFCWRSSAFVLDREQFLRSYLFAISVLDRAWALGCLGILLLHHTVGGKWGMVIRRLCEAGARTLPYMADLSDPDPAEPCRCSMCGPGRRRRTMPNIQAKGRVSEHSGRHRPSDFLFRCLDFLRVPAEQVVGGTGSHRRRAADRKDARVQRTGPGGVHLRHHVRIRRLDHVAGAALVLDHVRSDVPDRAGARILRVRDRAGDRAVAAGVRSRITSRRSTCTTSAT